MNVSKTGSTCRLPAPSSFELAKVGPFLLRRRKRYTDNVTAVYKNEKKRSRGNETFLFVKAFFHPDATRLFGLIEIVHLHNFWRG